MDEKEKKGKKRDRRRRQPEQSTKGWSIQMFQAYWQHQRVNHKTECLENEAGKVAGSRSERHSKELGDSELLKGFKTGNDMVRHEM